MIWLISFNVLLAFVSVGLEENKVCRFLTAFTLAILSFALGLWIGAQP